MNNPDQPGQPGQPPGGGFPPTAQNPYQPPLGQGPYRSPSPPPHGTPGPTDNRATVSMVLGIVGTVLCCLPLIGPVCGTIAIVLYAKFNRAYRESGETIGGKGMAIAGLVTGIVAAALGTLYSVYWVIWGVIMGAAAKSIF